VTIFRQPHRRHYTQVDNAAIEDGKLSFKALGILAYLLSKPDGWDSNYRHLATTHDDGETAVRSGLQELEAAGYLRRARARRNDGTIEWEIEVHEAPPCGGNPRMDNRPPCVGNPGVEEPGVEDPRNKQTLIEQTLIEQEEPLRTADAAHEAHLFPVPPTGPAAMPTGPLTGEGQTPVRVGTRNEPMDRMIAALVDAAEVRYADLPARSRGAAAKAARELLDVGATPDEVARRAANFRTRWQVTLTPSALASRWAECATPAKAAAAASATENGRRLVAERRAAEATR
jgi:hypothetical protein